MNKWSKVASVRSGGKPYFYVAFTDKGKRSVVWDRIEEKWAVTGEQQAPRGDAPTLRLFATSKLGMAFVDNS